MYTIIAKNSLKGKDLSKYDYILENLQSFYDIADCVTVPLKGRYEVLVYSSKTEEILNFIASESDYSEFNIVIVVPDKQALGNITLARPGARVGKDIPMFEVYTEQISKRNLIIDKRALSKLYASIGTSLEEMEEGLSILQETYGKFNLITLKDIAKVITLRDIVYPKQVMDAYLTMHRYRHSKLKACVEVMGEDIVYYAIRKRLKKVVKERYLFLKTSSGGELIKNMPTGNIMLMYYLFVVSGDKYPKNAKFILAIYERGFKDFQ